MIKRIYHILYVVIFFLGCKNEVKELHTYNLKVDKQYNTYSDSTYFRRIGCMQFYNDSIYILDTERQILAVASENFNKVKTIASAGRATNEIMGAYSFSLDKDTIYVIDQDKIKYYNQDKYLYSNKIDFAIKDERFCCDSTCFFIPYISGDNTFFTFSKYRNEEVNKYGSFERVGSITKSIRRNSRAVLSSSKFIITIPNAFPYFEYFNKETKKMLGRFNFSDIDFMHDNLDFVKNQPDEENSFYVLIEDSYIIDDNLFVLCNTFKGGFRTNTILKIALDSEPLIKAIYKLPGNCYSSICVSKTHIIAFNIQSSNFEYFLI